MIFCARATRGLRKMVREWPGALLARRTRTIRMCSFDARSKGQPWPLPNGRLRIGRHGTSRRASGREGEKVILTTDVLAFLNRNNSHGIERLFLLEITGNRTASVHAYQEERGLR